MIFGLQRGRSRWLAIAAVGTLVLDVGAVAWIQTHPGSLLPASMVRKLAGVQAYTFFGKAPAGYQIDKAHVTVDNNVLLVPLTGADGTRAVMTEQAIPERLTPEDILQGGDAVQGAIGKATINDMQVRLVGTMISPDHKTMVLITASQGTSKDDLAALLRGLRPVR
jgi:hypothetical protein